VKITCRLLHLRWVVALSVFLAVSMMSLVPSAYGQSIKLAWDRSADASVAGYNVYRSQQSGAYPSTPLNGAAVIPTTAFNDSSVQSGATYFYVVTAVNTSGVQSGYSNQIQATAPVLTTNKAPVVNAGADQTITLPAKATLTAAATDDGLPNGVLTYSWSVIHGTGVTLSSQTASSIQATFSAAGMYTFRVTLSDGQLSSSDDVTVTAIAGTMTTNKPPVVNAGTDQTITLPAKATLTAAATDDGLPNGALTYRWTFVRTSTLSTPTSAFSVVYLNVTGEDLVGSEGQLSPNGNPDWHIQLHGLRGIPTTVRITSDTGGIWETPYNAFGNWVILPQYDSAGNADLWFEPWVSQSFHVKVWYSDRSTDEADAAGTSVTLSSPTASSTQASFTAAGTYTFRVTVSDGQLSSSDDVIVTAAAPTLTTNKAPVVSGGTDQTITFPASATLAATASDDALPNGVLSYLWTVVNGTGVTLSSPTASNTQATFTAAGTYTFRVTVSDGQLSASDDVVVNVRSAPGLTLLVSKSGEVLRGAITSIKEFSGDSKVKRLELYIDQNKTAAIDASSLTYKWDLRNVSGTHVVSGKAYDASNFVVATADITVSVK
jgi:fibronectin type 3 domain-containing protein